MAYIAPNPNGSATSANSAPVVIASDQAAVPVSNASLTTIATNTTGLATSANLTAGTQTTRVTDGANTAAVKAASTAPAATDPALVVAISPNSPAHPVTVSSGTVTLSANTPTIAAGSAIIGKVGIDQTTVGTTNAVSLAQLGTGTIATGNGTSSTGTLRVAIASDQTTNTNPLLFKQAITATSSGMIVSKVLAAAATTPVQIKTTAGQIYGWHFVNNATSTRYVRFFNVSASPTMGTTSPTFVIPLPASGGAVLSPDNAGIPMATGIFYSITTGATDLDNTAPAANDVVGTIFSV